MAPYRLPAGVRYKTAAERAGARSSSSGSGDRIIVIPRPYVPRSPGSAVRAIRGDRGRGPQGSAILLLFGLLVAVDLLRRGWPSTPIPNGRRLAGGYAAAALVFTLTAIVAPDFARLLLVGILVLQGIRAAPVIAAWLNRALGNLGPATGSGGGGGAGMSLTVR